MLSGAGVVRLVGSTAHGRSALGGAVGARSTTAALRRAHRVGPGMLARTRRGRTFVYATRAGRVRAVAVTSTRLARDRRALRAAMRRVATAKADNRPPTFVPADAQAKPRTLAGTGDRQVDARLAALCQLNL